MHFTRKTIIWLGVWGFIALALLLMPSPREWGPAAIEIRLLYEEIQGWLQPLGHFILMLFFARMLMPVFCNKRAAEAMAFTILIAACLALFFEVMQGFLPARFARQCDLHDLIPSLSGAVCGALLGLPHRVRTEQKTRE